VTNEAVKVLETIVKYTGLPLEITQKLFGGCAIDATGNPLPDDTLQSCKEADAILLGTFAPSAPCQYADASGAIGGPKWGVDAPVRPESGLLRIRKELGLYANIRPANFASESLLAHSPLRPEIAKGTNIITVRELIGGLYFGKRQELGADGVAWDTCIYSVEEVERITRVAAQIAIASDPPLPIHSIDKANVLATSRLWRKVVTEFLGREYPQIKLDHQLVDSAAMIMVSNPRKLNGVLLTENLFGDM
jgi:3-isopropylmalate dehydrogenase